MTIPTPPIPFGGEPDAIGERLPAAIASPLGLIEALATACPTSALEADRAEHGRDWWPLAMHWALRGATVTKPVAVCRPRSTDEVAHVVRTCAEYRVAVTAMGGRSGVCGAAIPVRGGVALDTTELAGVVDIDAESGLACVLPGTFGPDLERILRDHGLTVGHYPQSFALATVGGWVASRGSGQYSTRYGTIADMVAGLEVVSADGTISTIGPHPASSTGPDLASLYIGSEGTFGIITKIWLRCHPIFEHVARASYSFPSFAAGVAAMRDALRSGATPAVLRLYDGIESARSHGGDGTTCTLIVLDEGDARLVEATMSLVDEAVHRHEGVPHAEDRVAHWLEHRNDTNALQALTQRGFVIDTMEVSAPWSALMRIAHEVKAAAATIPGLRVASCHQSHSYLDGGCLYFTFVVQPPDTAIDTIERVYVDAWDVIQRAALSAGATLSHHHGAGLNRQRFLDAALGDHLHTLRKVKRALDPDGILNPGKLGDAPPVWP